MGHIAMGLLWVFPTWFIWSKRVSLAFIGFVAAAATLPDVDLWLNALFPELVHHHGVTHTVVFVGFSSVLLGAILALAPTGPIERRLYGERFDTSSAFAFVAGAIFVGGLSHLFTDMLSAPDIAEPIEPFWPVFDKSWSIDVIWYNSPRWNVGLLTVAVLVHLVIAYTSIKLGRSRRIPSK